MTLLDDIVNIVQSIEIFGRTGWQYLTAITIFAVVALGSYILRVIVIGRFENYLEQKEKIERVKKLVSGLKKVLGFRIIFIFALYLSLESLNPDPFVSDTLRFVLLLLITYFFIQFSFLLVDYLIEFRAQTAPDATNILEFFRLVLKTTMVIIISLWFLANLGVNTDVFIASIGVFSLAIAFALQNVITDVFAALTIYLDKPIEIGDTIVIGGEMGTVEKIGIRSTRMRTLTGHMLIVSNREVINARIQNYQKMQRRRVPFTVGVHYNTRPAKLREIPELLNEIITSIPDTQFDRAFVNNLGSSTIDFEVVYFVLSKSYSKYLSTHEQVTVRIIEKFREHNIEIPYPTQTLYLEKTSKEEN